MALATVRLLPEHDIDALEGHIQCQLSGRVRGLRLLLRGGGLILCGKTHTYHAKQLAQHAVMNATTLPIVANQIEVT